MAIPSAEQSANEIVDIFHSIAQEHLPVGIKLGLVLEFNPPTIRIAVDNIILDEKQLYLDQFLLQGYQRDTSGTTSLTNIAGQVALDKVSGTLEATVS